VIGVLVHLLKLFLVVQVSKEHKQELFPVKDVMEQMQTLSLAEEVLAQ
jgi:hypothetical protein